MRAAFLLSGLYLICGVAAFFGVPAIQVHGQTLVGLSGLVVSLAMAAMPPIIVLGWREFRKKWRQP
jgi:hypothetical protein